MTFFFCSSLFYVLGLVNSLWGLKEKQTWFYESLCIMMQKRGFFFFFLS